MLILRGREESIMSNVDPAWVEHQRTRWLRPDFQRWMRHDAHRFAQLIQTKSFAARRMGQRRTEEQATVARTNIYVIGIKLATRGTVQVRSIGMRRCDVD
jgi:hypothetical protein